MNIAKVFPRKTSMTPQDNNCYFGEPDFFTPNYDEVHISTVFTWDIKRAKYLQAQWQTKSEIVVIGGPAMNDHGSEFIPGKYLRQGITITSRGCPNNCWFCSVPKREGKIRELEIKEGNVVQDNNLLACSKQHIHKVFQMLRGQKKVNFKGGFEAQRITDKIIEDLRSLDIEEIWLSYDYPVTEKLFLRALNKLRKYFKLRQRRCYVLIGFEGDTISQAEERCKHVLDLGALPFAQRYRTNSEDWDETFFYKDREWSQLQRRWTRPRIMMS